MPDIDTKNQAKDPALPRKARVMKQGNVNATGRQLNLEEWEAVIPQKTPDVDDKVSAFNLILINISDDTMPLKTTTCNLPTGCGLHNL